MSMSIRPAMTPLGPIHVRLTGVVRGDEKGPGIGIVNAPTAAEATAELHRAARVVGADKVVSVAADYRRAALAGGTTSTQWRIEVQAWGTAMAPAKVDPAETPDSARHDADKARDDAEAKKAEQGQKAQAQPRETAPRPEEAPAAEKPQAAVPAPQPAAPPPAAPAAPAAEAPPVATEPAPAPAPPPPAPER